MAPREAEAGQALALSAYKGWGGREREEISWSLSSLSLLLIYNWESCKTGGLKLQRMVAEVSVSQHLFLGQMTFRGTVT